MSLVKWIQYWAHVLALLGLISDIFGTVVILSTDYRPVQQWIESLFTIKSIERIDALKKEITETRKRFRRGDIDGDARGAWYRDDLGLHKPLREPGDEGFTELNRALTRLLPHVNPNEVVQYEYLVTDGDDLDFNMMLTGGMGFTFTVDDGLRSLQHARDRQYYWQGGLILLIGFGLLFIAAIGRFYLFLISETALG